jgi:hypothetical protein
LQEYRGVFRSIGAAFYVHEIRTGRGSTASGAGRQVRQGGVCAQERTPDYRVVAAWSAFLIFLGSGALVIGMAMHNDALANQHVPEARKSSIYYFGGSRRTVSRHGVAERRQCECADRPIHSRLRRNSYGQNFNLT